MPLVRKSVKPIAARAAMGTPLGRIAIPDGVGIKAADVAFAFWKRQVLSDFTEQVDTLVPIGIQLDWVPHSELKTLGYKADIENQNWVMTTGVDPHIDRGWGHTLIWVLVNDGMHFKQGRNKHVHAVGEWFIFDDSVLHCVDIHNAVQKQAVFLGWAVKIGAVSCVAP